MTKLTTYNLNKLLARFENGDWFSKRFKSGDTVFRVDTEVSYAYFVMKGEVRVERYLQNGQSLVFLRVSHGGALSEAALFLTRQPYTAVADKDSELVLVRKDRLLELMQRDWKFTADFFHCMVWRYTEALMLQELTNVRSAVARLRMWFEWRASMGEREFQLEGRMGTLGADLGLTRESVYRALAHLDKSKFLKRENGNIHVMAK